MSTSRIGAVGKPAVIRLHMIHGSHACVVVQRALAVKGLGWKGREMLPPTQVVVMRRRFGGTTVPGIEFPDGEKVQGSIAILRRLDERHPDPPLYPADPERRRRAADAEAWGSDVPQKAPGLRCGPEALAGARVIPAAREAAHARVRHDDGCTARDLG
jgi:glutathione S-transferase